MASREELEKQRRKIIEGTKEIVLELRDHNEEYDSIDISKLEKDGIIVKKGAWYLVPNMNKVPEALKFLISEFKQDPKENGILVKITKKKNPFSKTLKKFEKLGF